MRLPRSNPTPFPIGSNQTPLKTYSPDRSAPQSYRFRRFVESPSEGTIHPSIHTPTATNSMLLVVGLKPMSSRLLPQHSTQTEAFGVDLDPRPEKTNSASQSCQANNCCYSPEATDIASIANSAATVGNQRVSDKSSSPKSGLNPIATPHSHTPPQSCAPSNPSCAHVHYRSKPRQHLGKGPQTGPLPLQTIVLSRDPSPLLLQWEVAAIAVA